MPTAVFLVSALFCRGNDCLPLTFRIPVGRLERAENWCADNAKDKMIRVQLTFTGPTAVRNITCEETQ